jgi:hypothetical protein
MRTLAGVVVLSSVAHAGPAPVGPEELRHELFDQVVIADAERDWGTGAITVDHAPSEHDTRLVLTRAIDPKRVPAALRARRGRKVIVGLATPPCTLEVSELRVMAVTEPNRETGFWDGAVDPLPARGTVLATWNASHVWLTGELAGDCAGRRWVRAAELKSPTFADQTMVSGPLCDQVLAAFRTLPAYRAVQARFRGDGEWDGFAGGPRAVLRFDLPGRTLISHAAYVHDGQLDEQLLVIWELVEGSRPALKLRRIAKTATLPHGAFGLTSAIDLRGDDHMLLSYAAANGRGALYETGDKLVEVPALRLATP